MSTSRAEQGGMRASGARTSGSTQHDWHSSGMKEFETGMMGLHTDVRQTLNRCERSMLHCGCGAHMQAGRPHL